MFWFGRPVQRKIHSLKHSIDISNDVVIPKANDFVSFACQPSCPHLVAHPIRIVAVLRPIDLDDQSSSHARKVDDMGTDWHLSAEMAPESG